MGVFASLPINWFQKSQSTQPASHSHLLLFIYPEKLPNKNVSVGRNLNRPERGVQTTDFRSAFDIIDADRDGKISREDLRSFYAGFSNGLDDDEEMIETMIAVADLNKDGFVEYEEFERVLVGCKNKVPSGYGVMEDVFKVMDKDGDGRLSHEDLKSFMSWAGFSASDEDIKAMMRFACGADGESGVTFDGLLKILAVDFSGSF